MNEQLELFPKLKPQYKREIIGLRKFILEQNIKEVIKKINEN